MTIFAAKTKNAETDSAKSNGIKRKSDDLPADSINTSAPLFGFPIQRKAECACGGGCPGCQAKYSNLSISQPDDIYENEADVMADKVMRMQMPEQTEFSSTKNSVQKKGSRSNSNSLAPLIVQDVINSSGGKFLDESARTFMESRFDYDFSNVKIHDNQLAAKSANSINALAYTSGNNVVFNSGQYNPNSYSGRRLLAHELTHVVQQNSFVQRQTSNASVDKKEITITEELIDIPMAEEFPMIEPAFGDEVAASTANDLEMNEPSLIVQRTPASIQRDDAPVTPVTPVTPVRKDIIFIMGTSGGFYKAAKKFFSQHHPEAEIVDFKDRSLSGIFSVLRTKVSDTNPAGNIYIVSHANQDGTLSFPLHSKDKDKTTGFGELKVALKDNASMFELAGGIDDETFIHIKGCNIGRNIDMLNVLDEAFGGQDKVDAPTHRQGYEYHSEKVGKKSTIVSSEYFNKFILEYPGNQKKDTETLVADFKKKYSELGYEDHEWKMMVMGAKKYDTSIKKDATDKKKAIDKETKDKKKEVDKTDKDGLKAINEEAKAAKTEVDAWVKEMKTTKVAKKSPGIKKDVDLKFTVKLYNDVDPSIDPSKALPFGVKWLALAKDLPKGFKITKCTSISANPGEPSKFDFEFLTENKKTGETKTMIFTTAKIPKTDEEGSAIADEWLEENIGKKPESEIARKNMYSWRIKKEKTNNSIKITAFLEMTQYSINMDLKEESGDNIDPATKEDDDFYYGESDFE